MRNVSDEIANDFDLINIIIRDFQSGELVFDKHRQFKTIKLIGPEIFCEVRVIRDQFDIHIQMVGRSADFVNLKTFFHDRQRPLILSNPIPKGQANGYDAT